MKTAASKKKKKKAAGTVGIKLQFKRKMSADGQDPFSHTATSELQFKNLTEKAKIKEH